MADKQSRGDLTVKIDVDVSEALTGLKAVQREAREATKALRELEVTQKEIQALPRGGVTVSPTGDWQKIACENITSILENGDD